MGFPARADAASHAIARAEAVTCDWIHSDALAREIPFGVAFFTRPKGYASHLTVSAVGRRAGLVRQPKAGQRHAREADAEFLQRRAARDRLGHAFGEIIELVIHTFPFPFVCFGCGLLL